MASGADTHKPRRRAAGLIINMRITLYYIIVTIYIYIELRVWVFAIGF